MAETSAQPTGYTAFVDNMRGVLERSFGHLVPTTTNRSKGLDPQCGLILGLGADDVVTNRLVSAIEQLPSAWSQYDNLTLHLTLGACEDRSTSDVTLPLADGRSMEERYGHLLGLEPPTLDDEVRLSEPFILFSGDTIILTGQPSRGLYEIGERLVSTEQAKLAGLRRGWGTHFTLARAMRQLTDDERSATDQWVARLRLPWVINFNRQIAAAFSVSDDSFDLARCQVRELPTVK